MSNEAVGGLESKTYEKCLRKQRVLYGEEEAEGRSHSSLQLLEKILVQDVHLFSGYR